VKLSILFFYLRIAATRFYRRLIYASIAFIIAWLVTFTFAVIFVRPPPFLRNGEILAKIWKSNAVQYQPTGITNLISALALQLHFWYMELQA
jgi:hypothetical protein